MWHKHKAVRQEARTFSFVGVFVTAVDFMLLNIGTLVFHLSLIAANVISTTITSVLSFRLNRRLTFSGQKHGHLRTIFRYGVIVGISVYLIQNLVLYLVGNHFDYPAAAVLSLLEAMGLPDMNPDFIGNNVAKALAAFIASIWNFFMLRRFVFLSSRDETDQDNTTPT